MTTAAILLTLLSVILSATVPRPVDLWKAKNKARARPGRFGERVILEQFDESGRILEQFDESGRILGVPRQPRTLRRREIRVWQRHFSGAPEGVVLAVITHESGHLTNRDAVRWWRYAAGFASVTLAAWLGTVATVGLSLAPPVAIAAMCVYVCVVWLPRCRQDELAASVTSLRSVSLTDAIAACEWMAAFRRKIPTWISAHPSTANQIKALKAAGRAGYR